MSTLRRTLMVIAYLTIIQVSAVAADRYVWRSAPSSAPPYETWNTAATNIQDAVNVAQSPETVWVTNDTYGVLSQIVVTNSITVKSMNGKDVTFVTRSATNEYRIFLVSNATAVVDGFTISNGYARAPVGALAENSYGGGILLYNGTVRNCRIVRNTCRADPPGIQLHGKVGYGGGVYIATGLVENCEINNNIARGSGGSSSGYGGGIASSNGAIVSCVITGNNAYNTGNGYAYGGGVFIIGAGTIINSQVDGNWLTREYGGNCFGGGIYLVGAGMVSNCVVSGNRTTYVYSQGGGIYMSTGLVTHCRIISNRCNDSYPFTPTAYSEGGGVRISGGTLRNCVIAENRAQHDYATRHPITRGAGIYIAGGRVEQCTVSRNSVVDAYGRGDGIYMTAGVVWNSIVYYNFDDSVTNYTADHENIYQTGGSVNYSCTTNVQGLSGVSNFFADPGFADRWTNDFRLLPSSPCIDSGTNLTEVTTDIAGNPRPQDGNGDALARHDMGAYEASPVTNGSFRINFTTAPEEAIGAADVVFTASAAGTNTTGLTYAWDFTNDGTPDAYAAAVTNSYGAPGYYTVKLIVSNSVSESATVIKQAAVRVFPSVVFVATTGSHTFPFDTWAKASTNLPPAINAAFPGTTVTLGPAAYAVTSPVSVRRGVSVLGSEGPSNTAVERVTNANTRIFTVSHSNAVVEGLTIRNGWYDGAAPYNHEGGGVLLIAGMVRNCVISNNYVRGQPNGAGRGGGACLWGGTLRNCLVFLNEARSDNTTAGGGGVYMIGGSVENCTVVSNYTWRSDAGGATDATRGGGIWMSGGSVTNTIVVNNRIRVVTNIAVQISISGATNIGYSCSPDLTHDPGGTGNITNAPMFVATTDYHLVLGSPGIDAGVNQAWMTGATDLDGNNRIRMGTVDMGAYEYQPPRGTIFTIPY